MDDVNLHGTLDATVWAAAFCKRWPSALCQIAGHEGVSDGADFEATMIGWFANAIMTGYDIASRESEALIREAETRGMERAADICNERGTREEENFGLVRGTQNYYRARDTIRAEAAAELAAANARESGLREALETWVSVAENCTIESGVCCCGDNMESHSNPMDCGHSPVDSGDYAASGALQQTRAALAQTNTGGVE